MQLDGHHASITFWNRGAGQKHYAGLFPGAACCRLIELRHYEAAPLQALGMSRVFLRRTSTIGSSKSPSHRGKTDQQILQSLQHEVRLVKSFVRSGASSHHPSGI
jgi:hypothetical protein